VCGGLVFIGMFLPPFRCFVSISDFDPFIHHFLDEVRLF